LNSINFNKIKDVLSERDNENKLEKILKDRYFATEVNKTDHIIKAIVFDNFLSCDAFCGRVLKGKYEVMGFEQFRHTVGDNWHNPDCYQFSKCDDDEILFACELASKNMNYQKYSDNFLLSDESFQQLGKAICEEQIRCCTDKYGGLTLNKDELKRVVESKYFGVSSDGCGTKAAIFDSREKCEFFCELSPSFSVMTFEQFKKVTNGRWENPNRYYIQQDNWIIYVDEEI